jgi:eukaryotic-like serine/threonine-protein kinase
VERREEHEGMVRHSHLDQSGSPLLDAVLNEQRARWNCGDRLGVEEYLSRYPGLRDDSEAVLDLIYQEFLLRRELGEAPRPEEYIERFPGSSEALIRQFAVDDMMRPIENPKGDVGHLAQTTTTIVGNAKPEGHESSVSISGYEILATLGRGGMGIVYKARDNSLGRIVAIKTIDDIQHASQDQRDRFMDEARAIARLKHPHIIPIHAIGDDGGRPYFSLEFAEGGSLAQRLAEGPMASAEAAALVETLARAVHAAHQAGIVHRDLKPSNVLLTSDQIPKIADFGLAKLLDADSARTLSGQTLGTPSFMSPEQAEGHSHEVGPSADIYSLGAILYQTLTGRPPFLGGSAMETMKQVVSTEVVPPSRLRPDVARDLETICLKCLEKAPRNRYPNAQALADDLRRFQESRPILARPTSLPERSIRWCRRNPWVAASLAILMAGTTISTWQAVRATAAESAARNSEAAATTQRKRAESETEIAKAVNDFLNKDVLAQASVAAQAGPGTNPDPELKVRTALDRASDKIGERFAARPIVQASILQTIGEAYFNLGLYPKALRHLERAWEIRRREMGGNHPDTLETVGAIGTVYREDGKLSEAEPLLLQAMNGLSAALGAENPQALAAAHNVALLYYGQGKLPEAESLLLRLREVYQRAQGATGRETLEATNSLAVVYLAQNKLEEAQRLLADIVEMCRSGLGIKHPSTITVLSNLGLAYRLQGKLPEAERCFAEVLGVRREMLGSEHPETLYSMASLGALYVQLRQPDKAEPLLNEALPGCRKALDRNSETTELTLATLASIYSARRDFTKLGPVLLEALQIERRKQGPDDNTPGAIFAVGMFFLKVQKDYVEAERLFRECRQLRMKKEPDDPVRFVTESHLGQCLLAQGSYTEAERFLFSAYRGLKNRELPPTPEAERDLRSTVELIIQLYNTSGRSQGQEAWDVIRRDPTFQIILDQRFPSNPFAPR